MVEKEIIIIHMHGVRRNGGHVSRMSTLRAEQAVTARDDEADDDSAEGDEAHAYVAR
jgi:hypothetical protein